MRSRALWIACLLVACGGSHERRAAAPTTETTSDPTPYDVHEWGLLRAAPGDALDLGGVPAATARIPLAVEKPVLYFHAEHAGTLRSVSVDIHGGSIVETWPLAGGGVASHVTWEHVVLEPGAHCAVTVPTASDAPCSRLAPGEHCEAADLAIVRTNGATCLHVGGASDTLLFYRARATAFTPPLTFERTSDRDDVRVTNDGERPIPGLLVRLRESYGNVAAIIAQPPAPHESIVVGHDFAAPTETPPAPAEEDSEEAMPRIGSPAPGRDAIQTTMRELGMDEDEVAAFLRAWDSALFALAAPSEHATERATEHAPPPTESFVYFLPEASCDEITTVALDPPPRALRRAFAIWTPIPDVGPSH
jgi:hypothetical protein